MRHFEYFLFENFDPDQEAAHPGNPRRILNQQADAILSRIADFPPHACPSSLIRREFGAEAVNQLIGSGALREAESTLLYDTPIFLEEDTPALRTFCQTSAVPLTELLWKQKAALWDCAGRLQNGFDPPSNLYHILCGVIFDGLLFDRLSHRGAVSISRLHSSGLDYLSVIYQNCSSLQTFSNGLLCSYNRLTDGQTSLQSFGDANGDRFDFYRLFRLRELGPLPERYAEANSLLAALPKGAEKQAILSQSCTLLLTGTCDRLCLDLLELFGYAKAGKICVPVYSDQDLPIIQQLESLAVETLLDPLAQTLLTAPKQLALTAAFHGVAPGEIANELYHILFGGINEALADLGLVAPPPDRPGEGRYWQCIEWQGAPANDKKDSDKHSEHTATTDNGE